MRVAALLVVVSALACAQEPQATQATAAGPREGVLVERVAVLPARLVVVGWFSRDQAPLLNWIAGLPGGVPPCLAEVTADLEGMLQASEPGIPGSVLVFQGRLKRDRVESCVRAIAEHVGLPATLEQSGPITSMTGADGKSSYLGWTGDGSVVSHRERSVVEEVLARKTSLRSNAALRSLLGRIDPARPVWVAADVDLTRVLIGVPSRGFFLSADRLSRGDGQGAPLAPLIVHFVFPDADVAVRAADALAGKARDPRFSGPLRAALVRANPVARGADVELDVAPFMEKTEVLQELTELAEAALAAQKPQAGPSPAE